MATLTPSHQDITCVHWVSNDKTSSIVWQKSLYDDYSIGDFSGDSDVISVVRNILLHPIGVYFPSPIDSLVLWEDRHEVTAVDVAHAIAKATQMQGTMNAYHLLSDDVKKYYI